MKTCKIAVFGLSLSSAWANDHATTWRSLLKALHESGHEIIFFERTQPLFAEHRDLPDPDWLRLIFYESLADLGEWADTICRADVLIVGSHVPEATLLAQRLRNSAPGLLAFYDIDTPQTVAQMERGDCAYLDAQTARLYDLYLSNTGGPFLESFAARARLALARPLHCSADPDLHKPARVEKRWDLTYLGACDEDCRPGLERLSIEVARRLPERRFAVAGAPSANEPDWPDNIERIELAAPAEHALFYHSSRFTLNVSRQDAIAAGYSPGVRLFEAAACSTAIVSDEWRGLGEFFSIGREIFVARRAEDVIEFVTRTSDTARETMGAAARRRVLDAHTGAQRAEDFEAHLADAMKRVERVGKA